MRDEEDPAVVAKLLPVLVLTLLCVLAAGGETPAGAQSEIPAPPPSTAPPLPHERLAGLMGKVRELVGPGSLSPGQGRALADNLERCAAALRVGDAGGALQHLASFERQAGALVTAGALNGAAALVLAGESALARAHIEQLAFGAA